MNTSGSVQESFLHACGAVNIVLLILLLWMLLALIVHGLKAGKFKPTDAGRLYTTCLISMATAVPKYILDVIRYYLLNVSGALDNCEVVIDVDYVFAGIAIFSSYFFLWFRQRRIYANPFLATIYTRWIKLLSSSLLVVIVSIAISFVCLYIIPTSYMPGKTGCLFIPASNTSDVADTSITVLRAYVLSAFMVIGQLTLFGLFLYPMTGKRPSLSDERDRLFAKVIRRCTICAFIAIFSDIMTAILVLAVIPWDYPALISHTVYNVSIFVNAVCILSTFGNNAEILTWKLCRE